MITHEVSLIIGAVLIDSMSLSLGVKGLRIWLVLESQTWKQNFLSYLQSYHGHLRVDHMHLYNYIIKQNICTAFVTQSLDNL